MSSTPHFDKLAAALFDSEHKVADIVLVEGLDPSVGSERLTEALHASMERMGLIVDGRISPPGMEAAR